jgi:dipeptidyl aminopeptidase/acylaminoacyl peptidase
MTPAARVWQDRRVSDQPFDFDRFLGLPRLSDLRLAPDDSRLVVGVAGVAPEGTRMRTALWAVDPAGVSRPIRLTRSAKGESAAAFLPDGSLVFASERPDPDKKPETGEDVPGGLWLLPKEGGEARLLIAPKAGVGAIRAARDRPSVAFSADLFPTAADLGQDAEREKARKDAGVDALLFETYPIQWWDHYLGPRDTRLFIADVEDGPEPTLTRRDDVTGTSGTALVPDPAFDIAADGSWIATTWARFTLGSVGNDLVRIDRESHARRVLGSAPGSWESPAISPDGRSIAAIYTTDGSKDEASRSWLRLVDAATGDARDIGREVDQWPTSIVWSPDGSVLYFTVHELGSDSIYRLEIDTQRTSRIACGASFADVCPAHDGKWVYAIRASIDRPPHIVRLDARGTDQQGTEIPSPAIAEDQLPRRGVLERVAAQAGDGVEVGAWLLRPGDASRDKPAPLVVFVHGGPIGTWNGWSWRWNANLLVERGYAVLMPDPAISLGYGQAFIDRGWGRWGEHPFSDVIAAVDAVLTRPDIDAARTALMGGSFGGYMANWVAGHTDRFKAIVTHASLWDLRPFHGTTDTGTWWEQEFGDPYVDSSRYDDHSPAAHVGSIRTPMLVIHGEKDARVPVSEALRLWTDLQRHDVPSKFLYFPDENHWVLKPQNARIWYETVLAFLDQHVLGKDWVRPGLL